MGESLQVDPNLLRSLAPELTALADMAHNELARLKETLDAQGQCWGDDEPGRSFGESYEPGAEKGLAGYTNLVDNLRRTSADVEGAADAFRNQDQDIGERVRNFRPTSGEPDWYTPTPSFEQSVQPSQRVSPSTLPTNGPAATSGLGATGPGATSAPSSGYERPQGLPDDSQYSPYQPQYVDNGSDTRASGIPNGQPADRAAGATAPPTARDAAPPGPVAAPPGTATPDRPAISGKRSDTPWSGPTPDTPWQRKGLGTPALPTEAGPRNAPGSAAPGRVSPPQPAGQAPSAPPPAKHTKPRREAKARRRRSVAAQPKPVESNQTAMEVVRALAARHGLRIIGFDNAVIAEHTMREMAAAIDDILGKYPFLVIDGIEITELGGDAMSRVQWESATAWIILDRSTVADLARLAELVSPATESAAAEPGCDERPMYSTIVNDLGRIMETAAGPALPQRAQASLIAEYRRISGPWDRTDTLANIVAGYRKWREQLSGRCFSDKLFQPRAALIEAFTEVELDGDKACGPAKILHHLVVENARGRSDTK
jgi:uncharacterized protein YukE